uniref:Phosphatidic acid phosphatase type 2/haloperoxidase domain-containing protein n=1 Tax=Meleagris gallopavo TaxID=9103 RepID=A0A803Y6P0_MELGA
LTEVMWLPVVGLHTLWGLLEGHPAQIKSVGMLQCCFCHWIGRYHLQNHQGSLGHGLVPMELIYYCDKYYNVLSWTEIVRKFNSLFPSLGIYAFGLFATDIFVNAGQVVTGNLAPHFLALCKPNYTALGCKQYTQFISSAHACTGNPDLIMKARKTFPSKEAALSIYAAMYLLLYLQALGTRLAKPVLCLGLMCLAFLTGINRVAEYRNHWSDVIAGFIIGISIAVFLVSVYLSLYSLKNINILLLMTSFCVRKLPLMY